ncbi:MAG: metal ABC transporter substrate-binding protein [Planctomycetota bacterium]
MDPRLTLLLIAPLGLLGCGGDASPTPPQAIGTEDSIYATTYPLFWAAGRMLANEREVTLALTPGGDPAHWEPSRELLAKLQRAELVVVNGAGLEGWLETAGLARSRVVDTSAGFRERLLEGEALAHSHGPGGEHTHAPSLPTTWVDPNNLRLQVGALAQALSALEPESSEAIAAARRELDSELRSLDRRWLELAEGLRERELFALDQGYAYLADRYGFALTVLHPSDDLPADGAGLLWVSGPDVAEAHSTGEGPTLVRVDTAAALAWDDAAAGRSYLEVARANLDRLEAALSESP